MTAAEQAAAALVASRARLRAELLPADAAEAAASTSRPRWRRLWALARVLALQSIPPAWRTGGRLLLTPVAEVAVPLVRRHPVQAIVVAAATGAALAWLRPWRRLHWAQAAGPIAEAVLAWAAGALQAKAEQPQD